MTGTAKKEPGWTRGHTGETAKDVKTTITDVAPADFVE